LICFFNGISSPSGGEEKDRQGTSVAYENNWAKLQTMGEPYAWHSVAKNLKDNKHNNCHLTFLKLLLLLKIHPWNRFLLGTGNVRREISEHIFKTNSGFPLHILNCVFLN